jgi:hypothetical protein
LKIKAKEACQQATKIPRKKKYIRERKHHIAKVSRMTPKKHQYFVDIKKVNNMKCFVTNFKAVF